MLLSSKTKALAGRTEEDSAKVIHVPTCTAANQICSVHTHTHTNLSSRGRGAIPPLHLLATVLCPVQYSIYSFVMLEITQEERNRLNFLHRFDNSISFLEWMGSSQIGQTKQMNSATGMCRLMQTRASNRTRADLNCESIKFYCEAKKNPKKANQTK